ncbi:MAG: M23 family metallopeptidase [Actinobacteria bacterium]|nr:M23 family metallopeptidase [Actinomycetota bacterium]
MHGLANTSNSTPKYRAALVAALAVALILCLAPGAAAASGGVQYVDVAATGGTAPDAAVPDDGKSGGTGKRKRKRAAKPPVITSLELVSDALVDEGRPLKLNYRIVSRARKVRVRLVVRTSGGRYVRTVQIGLRRTRQAISDELSQQRLGVDRPGSYKLRMIATDGKGRRAARAAKVPTWLVFNFADHRFPLTGPFSWGGDSSRFGSGRPGHIHQGQDLSADEGSPIVAPYGGTITWVKYQADGAGWYVVLAGNDDRDYVFMHLKTGSIEVEQGQSVPTGKLLARVGNTGASSGPHLHFEIWTGGPWQFGGKPVDPRPLLEQWYENAPGGAHAAAASMAGLRVSAAGPAPGEPLD